VRLWIERPVGVVGHDGRNHGAGQTGRRSRLRAGRASRDGLDFPSPSPPPRRATTADALVAGHQIEERDILRRGDSGRRNRCAGGPPLSRTMSFSPVTGCSPGKDFRSGGARTARQAELLRPALPGHFRLTFLCQVIAHGHVFAEMLHGTN